MERLFITFLSIDYSIYTIVVAVSKLTIDEVTSMKDWQYGDTAYEVKFNSDYPIGFCQDVDAKFDFKTLGPMDLIDCFFEKYLIVNTVTSSGN